MGMRICLSLRYCSALIDTVSASDSSPSFSVPLMILILAPTALGGHPIVTTQSFPQMRYSTSLNGFRLATVVWSPMTPTVSFWITG